MINKCFLIVDGASASRVYAENPQQAIEDHIERKGTLNFKHEHTSEYLKYFEKEIKSLADIRCYELNADEQHRISIDYFKSVLEKFNRVHNSVKEREAEKFRQEMEMKQKKLDEKKEEEIKLLKELMKKYPTIKGD